MCVCVCVCACVCVCVWKERELNKEIAQKFFYKPIKYSILLIAQ